MPHEFCVRLHRPTESVRDQTNGVRRRANLLVGKPPDEAAVSRQLGFLGLNINGFARLRNDASTPRWIIHRTTKAEGWGEDGVEAVTVRLVIWIVCNCFTGGAEDVCWQLRSCAGRGNVVVSIRRIGLWFLLDTRETCVRDCFLRHDRCCLCQRNKKVEKG